MSHMIDILISSETTDVLEQFWKILEGWYY